MSKSLSRLSDAELMEKLAGLEEVAAELRKRNSGTHSSSSSRSHETSSHSCCSHCHDPRPACQVCGKRTDNRCTGCNNYTHSPGPICKKCSEQHPCTYGNW
jgi:hypothetical protein